MFLGGGGNRSLKALSGIYTYIKESTIPSGRQRAWRRRSRTIIAPFNMFYGFNCMRARASLRIELPVRKTKK